MADGTPNIYGSNWRQHSGRSGTTSLRRATNGVEVVYYAALPDDLIKIGTSANVLRRASQHGLAGRDSLLAIEFGGRALERARHHQFAHLRVGKTERFTSAPDLLAHIEQLRQAYLRSA